MKNKKLLAVALAVLALIVVLVCVGLNKKATEPTTEPIVELTVEPTAEPTVEPTVEPTIEPIEETEAEPMAASEEIENDPILATAYQGEIAVRASDVKTEFDTLVESYVSYYAQYGYQVDKYDMDLQNSVAKEAVQMRISKLVAQHHAEQTGYVLTPELDEQYRTEAQGTLDEMLAYYKEYLLSYGVEESEVEKTAQEELTASGYTLDALYDSAKLMGILDHLYKLGTEGVTVTEEEVKQSFDARVEEQKATYDADVDSFIQAYVSEEEILYTPSDVRLVQCIFIASDDEEEAEVENEATASEAVDPSELTGKAKALAVLAKVQAGEDFVEMMELYNEDASSEEQRVAGYPIAENSAVYGDAFKNGAMAIAEVGGVSDLIEADYGYFILRYVGDLAAGSADFESHKEEETATLLTNKQNDAYSTYVDTMLEDAGVVLNDMTSLYNIYVTEYTEATVAYVSVTEDADLTDKPEGEAVAKLTAGASLNVLGKIAMDGETYLFVEVMGTELKGYVKQNVTATMEEEAAQATDNSTLATACEMEAQLPTFTIAMNDGSLIYGELYPDQTPESVGNFVALANSGFYNGLNFHRVIPGFMIQGGDPNGDGTGGPGYAIQGEFEKNGVTNSLSHTRGVLSMARSSEMNSAGSQFFIMHADSDYLDGEYAAFGMVLGGIETVDLIASQPTNSSDKPMSDQTMRAVYVETYGQTYTFTKLED